MTVNSAHAVYLICNSPTRGRMATTLRIIAEPVGNSLALALPISGRNESPVLQGDTVTLVLSEDRRTYLPVRTAIVDTVASRGPHLELQLRLGQWLVPAAPLSWSHAFSDELEADDPWLVLSRHLPELDDANHLTEMYWEQLVQHMARQARFRNTVFFRLERVQVGEDGTQLYVRFCNPHLGEAAAQSSVEVVTHHDGVEIALATIPAQAEGLGSCRVAPSPDIRTVSLRVSPNRTLSWQYSTVLPVTAPTATILPEKSSDAESTVPQQGSTELWPIRMLQFGALHLRQSPGALRSFLEEYLLPLAPGHPGTVGVLGRVCLELGDVDHAYEVLSSVSVESLGEPGALTLMEAAAAVGADLPLEELLLTVSFDRPETIRILRTVIRNLGEAKGMFALGKLVGSDAFLAEAEAIRFLEGWEDDYSGVKATLEVADYLLLYLGDGAAYNYLRGKGDRVTALSADNRFCEQMLGLSDSRENLADRAATLLALARRAIMAEDDGMLHKTVACARRRLSQANLVGFLQELVESYPLREHVAEEVDLRLHLARALRESGDLEEAVTQLVAAAEKANSAGDVLLIELVEAERSELEARLRDTSLLQEYLNAREDQVVAVLRPHLVGKRLIVVNSHPQPWVTEVEQALGAKIIWYESSRDHKLNMNDVIESVRAGSIAVVAVNTYRAGHSGLDMLRQRCTHQGIPCCYVPKQNKQAMLRALMDVLA